MNLKIIFYILILIPVKLFGQKKGEFGYKGRSEWEFITFLDSNKFEYKYSNVCGEHYNGLGIYDIKGFELTLKPSHQSYMNRDSVTEFKLKNTSDTISISVKVIDYKTLLPLDYTTIIIKNAGGTIKAVSSSDSFGFAKLKIPFSETPIFLSANMSTYQEISYSVVPNADYDIIIKMVEDNNSLYRLTKKIKYKIIKTPWMSIYLKPDYKSAKFRKYKRIKQKKI